MKKLHWAPIFATALMCVNCYLPGGTPFSQLGGCVWAAYFIVVVLKPQFRKKVDSKIADTSKRRPSWLVFLLLVISVISLTPIPARAAFMISQAALLDLAQKTLAQKTQFGLSKNSDKTGKSAESVQAGAFRIIDRAAEADGGAYLVTGGDLIDKTEVHGFAYKPRPTDRLENKVWHKYRHIEGDWYEFVEMDNFI